jgi:ParB family chromosome partitioning protein
MTTLPKRQSKAEAHKTVMDLLLDKEPGETTDSLFIDELVPFANHPFKLYTGERLDDMVRSIRELGVIVPVIVRPIGEGEESYEILSGHNRVNAAKLAGLKKVPVVIKLDLTDEDAALIVTETNLVQRSFSDLSHSERAIALKQHMDAISKQGKRTDLLDEIERLSNPDEIKENGTSAQVVPKLAARDKIAEKYGLNRMNVTRYLRLNYLSQSLLDRIDSDEIAFIPAVSLSYLTPDEQDKLNRLLGESAYKIDMKKAESLREFSKGKNLTDEKMEQILSGELNKKPKPKTPPPFRLKAKIYQKFFNGDTTQAEAEIIIDQALTEYFENHKEESA